MLREIDSKYLKFKKDMSNIEIVGIERILENIYKDEELLPPVEAYGFVYTSSSAYAMYNVTYEVYFDEYLISHFAITENDMLIMVCYDEDEGQVFFEVSVY